MAGSVRAIRDDRIFGSGLHGWSSRVRQREDRSQSVRVMTSRSSNKPISLTRFLIEEQRDKQHINADLRLLIEVVARACKSISIAVGKGALGGVLGSAGKQNVQGEVQKKLDLLSNKILLEAKNGADILPHSRPGNWRIHIRSHTAIQRANTCSCSIPWTAPRTST